MDEEKKELERKCFIITPIGNDNSDIFRKAKGVIESVIKPVLQKKGFKDIKPAYEIMDPGTIGNQVIDRIVNDDLVVTNLTGNNPNVMYELAIRHAIAKPIIHICERETNLPFDIKDSRTIFYTDDMLGVQELQGKFEMFVNNIDYDKEYMDNPIYSGIRIKTIFKKIHDEGQQDLAEILQKIWDKVSNLPRINNTVIKNLSQLQEREFAKIILKCNDSGTAYNLAKDMSGSKNGIRSIYSEAVSENLCAINLYVNPGIDINKVIDSIYQRATELGIEIDEIVSF